MSSLPSFLSSTSHDVYVTLFVVAPELDILFWFLQIFFFSLLFSFRSFYWDIAKLRDSFLSRVQYTNKLIKGILHICYSILISGISVWFLLRIFTSLATLSIYSYMLSSLSIRGLSILIIIFFNFQSCDSNIPAMSESGSHTCSASSNCVFCLLICLVIFLDSQTWWTGLKELL